MTLTFDEESHAREPIAGGVPVFEPADLNNDRSITIEELLARPGGDRALIDWRAGDDSCAMAKPACRRSE